MKKEIEKFCEIFNDEMNTCEISYYNMRNERRDVDVILRKIKNSDLEEHEKLALTIKLINLKKKFKNLVEDIQEDLIVTVYNA